MRDALEKTARPNEKKFSAPDRPVGAVAGSVPRHAERGKFDLVITDVNMPNMDGITLVRELRGLATYKYVPLLVLTTEATTERKQAGKAAGATGWLVKPFNPEKLLATIAKVLG